MSIEQLLESRGLVPSPQNVHKLEMKLRRMKLKQDMIEQRVIERNSRFNACFDGDWQRYAVCINEEGDVPASPRQDLCGYSRVTCCIEDEHFIMTVVIEATYKPAVLDGLLVLTDEQCAVKVFRQQPLPHCAESFVAGLMAYISVEHPEFTSYVSDRFDLLRELHTILCTQKRQRSE